MTFTELYDPGKGPMRIAGLMSGSGSNLKKIIEHGLAIESNDTPAPYKVVVIFTDNPDSNAEKIGREYRIPVIKNDLTEFYAERGKPKKDLQVRVEYDTETVELLKQFKADVAAYAGYMCIATEPLVKAYLGVNVHPANLSILNESDERKYTGDNAVRDAILAGEKYLNSTTHIIEKKVDGGRILMISKPLEVILPEGFDPNNKSQVNQVSSEHQNRLKEIGDWDIFPKTLEYLADGRYLKDENGNLYFHDWEKGKEIPIPNGLML